jgi:hypothetical protein
VSTIADDPPMLNWIYIDGGEVRHGGRQATLGHTIGPWGWSDDERWLTLDGETGGFIAIEGENRKWSLFLDREWTDSGDDVRWAPVNLRRRMELGMESTWVRDSEKDRQTGQ